MAIDSTPSQVATSALQAIPFGSIIGAPLKACIEAQAMAAQTSWQFIQEVGLNTDPETGKKEAVNVTFEFLQNGRMAQLNVPLLTIVPIPYIAIHDIDINFKANMKANYSSKKDSKATQSSQYSVEYTMDVAVKAGQDSMPAGLAKVLELLGSSLDVSDPDGTLEVSETNIVLPADGKPVKLIATYKSPKGLFEPNAIKAKSGEAEVSGTLDGDNMTFDLQKEGTYTLTAGSRTLTVKVAPSPMERLIQLTFI